MTKTRQALAFLLVAVMVIALAACTTPATTATTAPPAADTSGTTTADTSKDTTTDDVADNGAADEPVPIEREFYQIEMFNTYSNYAGIQAGWWGKILKDTLNMEINFISPQVAGGGDMLYQTRTAAGNLGDSIVVSKTRMIDLWKAGLLYNMKDDIAQSPNIQTLSVAYDAFKTSFDGDGIWALPGRVSLQPVTKGAGRGYSPEVAAYLRYDWYMDIGSPDITSMDSLLDVVQQMIEAHPTNQNGDSTFGFSSFPDWDGDSARIAREMLYFDGYTGGSGMFWMTNDGKTVTELADDNGPYKGYLKLFNNAYKRGLLDIDSSTQNWDAHKAKFDDGRVAFGWWPFQASSVFDSIDLTRRSPYAPVPIQGTTLNTASYNPYGAEGNAYAVGSQAKHPDRIVEMYDWLCSPEGIMYVNGRVEGVTYNMVDGEPVLTEFALDGNNDKVAPEEMGGGNWNDGSCKINYPLTHQDDPNILLNNFPLNSSMWPSTMERNANEFNTAWAEKYGTNKPMEYYQDNGLMVVTPGTDYSSPSEPSDITTIRAQIKELFQPASWRMIYAESDEEFESIWADMKGKLDDFGYQELKAYDLAIIEAKAEAIAKTLAEAN